jgi:predicted kinase
MPKLIITRGLPASGKTMMAKKSGLLRVNRDDLRAMLHDGTHSKDNEKVVRQMRNKLISTALLSGQDVICDDTNLEERTVRELHVLAWTHGAEFEVWDLCDVPQEQCIRRDAARILRHERGVGEDVIRSMAQRAQLSPEGGPAPAWRPDTDVARIVPYVADSTLSKAVIVDIDGTVALHVARSPYDYSRVSTDAPNPGVIAVVRALSETHQIIFLSGRPDSCETETALWLQEHVSLGGEQGLLLYMRAERDTRNDAIVKYELFDRYVRDDWNVTAVIDDRERVVRVWRTLGLTVLQCADGSF